MRLAVFPPSTLSTRSWLLGFKLQQFVRLNESPRSPPPSEGEAETHKLRNKIIHGCVAKLATESRSLSGFRSKVYILQSVTCLCCITTPDSQEMIGFPLRIISQILFDFAAETHCIPRGERHNYDEDGGACRWSDRQRRKPPFSLFFFSEKNKQQRLEDESQVWIKGSRGSWPRTAPGGGGTCDRSKERARSHRDASPPGRPGSACHT